MFIYFFSFKFVKFDFKYETTVSLSLNNELGALQELALVKVIRNKETGRSKGFAFVEMSNEEQATTAIETLSNSEFEGRRMIVAQARPKPEKSE